MLLRWLVLLVRAAALLRAGACVLVRVGELVG
jgi:hypothetical protein